jgi:hypothetical protein
MEQIYVKERHLSWGEKTFGKMSPLSTKEFAKEEIILR